MPTLTPRKDAWLNKLDQIRAHIAAEPSKDFAQMKSRDMALHLAEAMLPDVAELLDLGVAPGHVAAIAGAALGTFLANLSLEVGADDPPAAMIDLAVRAQIGAASCFSAPAQVRSHTPSGPPAPGTTPRQ